MQYNNKKLDERILARLTGKHYAQCQLAQFMPSKKIFIIHLQAKQNKTMLAIGV